MFFCNKKYAWEYLHASEQGRQTLPGSNYFYKIKSFGENHCLLGEKYIEFVKFSCSEPEKSEYCSRSTHSWVEPPCVRIPQRLSITRLLMNIFLLNITTAEYFHILEFKFACSVASVDNWRGRYSYIVFYIINFF